jgi:hypothetical protein
VSPPRAFGRGFLARNSHTCRRVPTGPGSDAAENRRFRSISARSAPHHPVTVVGLAPRVLPLTPRSCVHFLQAGERLLGSAHDRILLPPLDPPPAFRAALFQLAHSARIIPLCAFPAAKPEPSDGIEFGSVTVGGRSPHWLAVATFRCFHRLRSLTPPETMVAEHDSARGWFLCRGRLSPGRRARRSPPHLLGRITGRCDPPRGSG